VIGFAHLVSSVAVVVAYVVLRQVIKFDAPWIKYVAAGLLLVLAVKMFLEKETGLEKQHGHLHEGLSDIEHEHAHEHDGLGMHSHVHKHATGVVTSLWGIAGFAFALGFAHEEEFALLGLVAGGANAWALMLFYGFAVLTGLVLVTLACVRLFKLFESRLVRYEKYVPSISGAVLAILAAVIIFAG
jgi:high-affinity nickel permease